MGCFEKGICFYGEKASIKELKFYDKKIRSVEGFNEHDYFMGMKIKYRDNTEQTIYKTNIYSEIREAILEENEHLVGATASMSNWNEICRLSVKIAKVGN